MAETGEEKREILVGVTGSIAAYKAAEIVSQLTKRGYGVSVIMTKAAEQLIAAGTFRALTGSPVYTEIFDDRHTPEIHHIALADRAAIFLIAPATANFLGKAAAGIADDMLTTTVISVDCPIIIAPAMNDRMWKNPFVQRNVATLRDGGYHIVEPEEGDLACGRKGAGRLAAVDKILGAVEDHLP